LKIRQVLQACIIRADLNFEAGGTRSPPYSYHTRRVGQRVQKHVKSPRVSWLGEIQVQISRIRKALRAHANMELPYIGWTYTESSTLEHQTRDTSRGQKSLGPSALIKSDVPTQIPRIRAILQPCTIRRHFCLESGDTRSPPHLFNQRTSWSKSQAQNGKESRRRKTVIQHWSQTHKVLRARFIEDG
jgi:hypothetical protein